MKKSVVLWLVVLGISGCSFLPESSESPVAPMASTETAIVPPPMELLGQGARLPTPEELEQERQFDAERVTLAIEKLKSSDVHQRIVATETLNAYRIPESERQLSDTLLHDKNAEVRQSAALGLAMFKVLSDQTVNALFKALQDKDKHARRESLNTLLNYALRLGDDDRKFQQLLNRLRKTLRSGLHQDIRASLKAFIKDQEPVQTIFFSPGINPVQNHPSWLH